MSKSNVIGLVASCVIHLVILAALSMTSAPRQHSVDTGHEMTTLDVYLVPSDGHDGAPRTAARDDVALAEAPRRRAIRSLLRPPPAGASDGGSTAPAFAAYSSTASYSEYRRRLLDHIRPHQFYPAEGRAQRMQGIVQVGFVVERDGTVLEIWVETSSGFAALDAAAVDTVRRSQPLPFIPASLPDAMDVFLPVGFTPPARMTSG
jgi:TonB family protein